MKKTLMIILLLTTILMSGCVNVENDSAKICTSFKHGLNNANISVYMDGEFCVVEAKDWNTTTFINCRISNLFNVHELNIIFKIDEEVTSDVISVDGAKCTYNNFGG